MTSPKKIDFYWSVTSTTSHPPQGRLKVTGCWRYKQPERRRAYAARDGRKHRADQGNAIDGHKKKINNNFVYTKTAYDLLRHAVVEQFPSEAISLGERALSPPFRLQRCFASHCL